MIVPILRNRYGTVGTPEICVMTWLSESRFVRDGDSALDGRAEVRGREVPLEQDEQDDGRNCEYAGPGEDCGPLVVIGIKPV
ncbi:hypothetical protein ACWGID_08810 [Kribbella sp. NPDC054772]